jgi:hypothetical protein
MSIRVISERFRVAALFGALTLGVAAFLACSSDGGGGGGGGQQDGGGQQSSGGSTGSTTSKTCTEDYVCVNSACKCTGTKNKDQSCCDPDSSACDSSPSNCGKGFCENCK